MPSSPKATVGNTVGVQEESAQVLPTTRFPYTRTDTANPIVIVRASHVERDDGGAPVVLVLAIDTADVPVEAVFFAITATCVARHQVGRQVDVGQLALVVDEHARPLDCHKHVRTAVVVMDLLGR